MIFVLRIRLVLQANARKGFGQSHVRLQQVGVGRRRVQDFKLRIQPLKTRWWPILVCISSKGAASQKLDLGARASLSEGDHVAY